MKKASVNPTEAFFIVKENGKYVISAVLHQNSHNFGLPLQDGMVKGPMLVVLRDIQVDELRP